MCNCLFAPQLHCTNAATRYCPAILDEVPMPPLNPKQIMPLPLSENHPPNAGSSDCLPRGQITVTPVRTDAPSISVVCPTSMPEISVIALRGPGVPSSGTP